MTDTRVITPSLFLGEDTMDLPGAQKVASVADAVASIRSGRIAVLPPERWDLARQVMAELGMSEPMQADREHFAKTGKTLHAI